MQEPYFLDPAYFPAFGDAFSMPESAPYLMATTPVPVTEPFEPSSVASTASIFNDADTIGTMHTGTTAPSSITSGQSPRLVDLLLPGTDLNATPPEYLSFRSQYPDSFYQPYVFNEPPLPDPMDEDDNVEEIIRQPPDVNPDHEAWVMRLPSPSPSNSSSSSEGSVVLSRDAMDFILLQEPQFPHGSPEMLTLRFDRQTCGILSVKDGPTENPWRTLIWPLARDCPALYHAIASMTSFHACKNAPELRIQGIEHMRTSISALRSGIQNMRFDSAIATTLVLAFAESWDQDTTTGINHIKGAKALVNQALIKQQSSSTSLTSEEVSRLKFLCNTWIYMDVIARLTSVDEDESNDFVTVSEAVSSPFDADGNLDPLMGCAATLFPIIGAVANLVRRVRRSESISPTIITQAMELKLELENWVPPSFFETPEDPTLHIQHSIQTAEAYRWATLLYLHQAVPEIPSLSSEELAKKVLVYLATVPLSSRAVIVQIFPLTAAGCEAVSEEDRAWVKGRWEAMAQRMLIGVIDRCAEVAKEVWDRRDAYEMEKRKRRKSLKRSTTMDDEMSDALALGLMDFDGFGGTSGIGSKRRALSGVFDMPLPVKVEGERRDLRERERQRRGKRREDVGIEKLEEEYTVKGRLHWLGVMKDWQWEGESRNTASFVEYIQVANVNHSAAWISFSRYLQS